MDPEVIYFDQNVTVTRAIATILGTSYPVRALSSLTVRRREIGTGCAPVLAAFIGGIFVLLGAAPLLDSIAEKRGLSNDGTVFAFLALFFGASAIIAAMRHKAPPPSFDLVLVTMGGERVAMTSKDETYIRHIRAAIEQAILAQ